MLLSLWYSFLHISSIIQFVNKLDNLNKDYDFCNISDNSWTQRIEIHHPPTSLHADSRTRNEVKKSEDETIFDASRRELVNFRRAKTDLSEYDLGPRRSRLPIFVSNENARVWLDLNNKKSNR